MFNKFRKVALNMLLLAIPFPAMAAFTCVTNFDDFSGWDGTTKALGNAKIASDPSDSTNGNSVLEVSLNPSSNYLFYILSDQAVIPAETMGTVFFRMYFENPSNTTLSFGLGSTTAGGTAARLQAQAQIISGEIRAFNGGSSTGSTVITPSSFVAGEWYNFWFVINSQPGKYEVWSQGAQNAAPVKFETSSHHDGFVFRTHQISIDWTLHNTDRFTISFTNGNNTAKTYFDDLHVDNTGLNLTIPPTVNNSIPEPSFYAIFGGLILFLLVVAKHRYRKTIS